MRINLEETPRRCEIVRTVHRDILQALLSLLPGPTASGGARIYVKGVQKYKEPINEEAKGVQRQLYIHKK